MKVRRRMSEIRPSRDAVDDGTTDAITFGTMAIGLAVGAMEHLWPSWTPTVRYGHSVIVPSPSPAGSDALASTPVDAVQLPATHVGTFDHATSLAHQANDAVPSLHAVSTDSGSADSGPSKELADASLEQTSLGLAPGHDPTVVPPVHSMPDPANDHSQATVVLPVFDAVGSLVDPMKSLADAIDGLASLAQDVAHASEAIEPTATAVVQPVFAVVDSLLHPAQSLPDAIGNLASLTHVFSGASDAIEPAVTAAVQPVFDAVGSLLDPVESPLEAIGISSESAVQRIVDAPSSVTSHGIDLLSEVLGGPPSDPATSGGTSDLRALPATILGAATNTASAGDGGHAATPAVDTTLPEPLHTDTHIDTASMPDHAAAPVADVPPLQLGFLGQSYVDAADHHHDAGSHGMNSLLHGLV